MKNTHSTFLWILYVAVWSTTAVYGRGDIPWTQPHTIHEIPSGGIVISQPGIYILEHNLTWNPNSDGVAITIHANNVILDLREHTLESASSPFKTIGISAVGCENLQISSGTVKNMGLSGVQCNQCADIYVHKIVVDGLTAQDTVNYTVPTGILANECVNVDIDKCTVKNIRVRTGSSAAIQLTATLFSTVTKCVIKNLLNEDGACTGIGHLLCDAALVKSCTIHNLKSEFIDNLNTEGHTTIGIVPVFTTNLKIQSCDIDTILGCCDDAHGMSIFLCDGAIVDNCKVTTVIDGIGLAPKGAKATGIEIYASDTLVSHCDVDYITAINPEDKQATGFSCALCSNVTFFKCQAKHVNVYDAQGRQSPSLGYGTGFGWAPDPRPEFIFPANNVLYKECLAKHCQVGFDSWNHTNSNWDHVTSDDNDIDLLNLPAGAQRTVSCDPCSECGCQQTGCYPTPIVVTITNVATNNKFYQFKLKN